MERQMNPEDEISDDALHEINLMVETISHRARSIVSVADAALFFADVDHLAQEVRRRIGMTNMRRKGRPPAAP